ncbi:MAG: penicillin-binding protein 2 [Bacteroidia bacterium]|nr:penicillin-binding protein 2 [Bacteroidia bacterium]
MNNNSNRGTQILIGFAFILLLFVVRLLFLQVIYEKYSIQAQAVDMEKVDLYPSRGIIYDRKDRLYVKNTPIFDVMFMPSQITIPDTNILVEHLGLTREKIRAALRQYTKIDRYHWQPLVTKLDQERFGRFSEQMYKFEGIKVVTRPIREYNYPAGAHFLGYLSKIDSGDIKRQIKEDDVKDYPYSGEDLIGKLGIEYQYEKTLRGKKGSKLVLVDHLHRQMESYDDGKYDENPVSGSDIKLGVDADLQMLGEKLMQGKRGSIVAIEPSTGEILAFVSAPSYDPSELTGSNLGNNYMRLFADPELPLINRPLSAQYPPGSIFKMVQALAALAEGVIDENTHYGCGGSWFRNKGKPACHGAHGSVDLSYGIKQSCNSYFAEVYYSYLNHSKFKDIHESYQSWYDRMITFGIGHKLGVDIPDEKPGNLPRKETYDKTYGKKGWGALTIYSNSIGQGEILMTPLQMANIAVLIANRGWYYPPHFVVAEKASGTPWKPKEYPKIDPQGNPFQYEVVVDAMEQVVLAGTGTRARIDSITVCGKTGTVENKAGEDHSVFMAFAPKDKPKIAIAAIVENAGFGGTWSAPICAFMMEQYLKGKIKDPAKMQPLIDARFSPVRRENQPEAVKPDPNQIMNDGN